MKITALSDGIYILPKDTNYIFFSLNLYFENTLDQELPYLYPTKDTRVSLQEYIKTHHSNTFSNDCDLWVGSAYEVFGFFVMDKEPTNITYSGSGFNYGSCNMIKVPNESIILILAEND